MARGDADPMTPQVDSISGCSAGANLSFGLVLNAVCMVRLLLSESDGSPGCASSQEAVIWVRCPCDSHRRAQVGLWASSACISFLVLAVSPSLAILSGFFAILFFSLHLQSSVSLPCQQ